MKKEPEYTGPGPDAAGAVRRLLVSQTLAVLSTQRREGSYASLVAFAPAGDFSRILFATSRSTRKYANLSREARVALLVDDRSNSVADFHRATAVTVIGKARELEDEQKEAGLAVYLGRHPYLEDFARSPSCALFEVSVTRYILVTKFQRVSEVDLRP